MKDGISLGAGGYWFNSQHYSYLQCDGAKGVRIVQGRAGIFF